MADITDVSELQADLDVGMAGNGIKMIGTSVGGLSGVPPGSPAVNQSPCAQLKWLEDNTPFNWEAYVTLTYDGGYQGLRVTRKSNGTLVRNLKFPIMGGDDSDPYRQIPVNHRRMIAKAIAFVTRKLTE